MLIHPLCLSHLRFSRVNFVHALLSLLLNDLIHDDDIPDPKNNFYTNNYCAEGLICYFWGDVVMLCSGTCRYPGNECQVDSDCHDDEVCYYGYCEWC